ncbi:MAG: hypothetical protein AAGD11_11255 [Planctomycetota bacterium]
MATYPIIPNHARNLQCGNFSAMVNVGKLEVPKEVWNAAQKFSIHNAAELVSYAYTFPTVLADELGWSADDFEAARAQLTQQLKGFVPDSVLRPPQPTRRAYGALPPQPGNARQS